MKRCYIDLENIFAIHITNKGLLCKISKEFLQVNLKKVIKQPLENKAINKRRNPKCQKHKIMLDFISNKQIKDLKKIPTDQILNNFLKS